MITHQKGVRIVEPGPGVNLGMFEIKDYKIGKPETHGNQVVEKYQYFISVFDTGHFQIPPFPVAFFPADSSQKPQIIRSEPISIYVKSVLTRADAELKDIKPPIGIPFNYRTWIFIGGGILILLALVAFGWWYWRQRQKGKPVFRRETIRPAHEMALEELEQLLASPLQEQKRWKEFFTILSDILRRYVEKRFFVPAMENTTGELLQSLEEVDVSEESLQYLESVLQLADLVKFARYTPAGHEVNAAIQQSRKFIELTRLEFQPVEVEEPVEHEETAAPKEIADEN